MFGVRTATAAASQTNDDAVSWRSLKASFPDLREMSVDCQLAMSYFGINPYVLYLFVFQAHATLVTGILPL